MEQQSEFESMTKIKSQSKKKKKDNKEVVIAGRSGPPL